MADDLIQLRRLSWAVRAVFTLGIAASLAGNVLHAQDNPISQAISAWPPLALLLAVELISRVPARRGASSVARFAATAVIAGIAAWVSYWHMVGVALRYGETGASAYLLPFAVDGLIVVASISLVEIGGRIRALNEPPAFAPQPLVPTPLNALLETVEEKPEPAAAKSSVKRVTPRPASADRVAKVAAKMPGASATKIAEKAGVSPSTARRHLAALRVSDASSSAQAPAEQPVLTAA